MAVTPSDARAPEAFAALLLCLAAGCADAPSPCDAVGAAPAARTVEAGADAPGITLTIHPVSWPEADVHHVVPAPGGGVWFTDLWNSCVGRLDPRTLDVREHALPEGGRPHSIAAAGGALWFTVTRPPAYGRLDLTSGAIELYAPEAAEAGPYDVAAAGAQLWITAGDRLLRIGAESGEVEAVHAAGGGDLSGVAVSPTGEVWYADRARSVIGRVRPGSDAPEELPTAGPRAYPRAVAAGPAGRVWYYEEHGHRIVALDPRGGAPWIVEIPELPEGGAGVRSMAADEARGMLWVALGGGGAVGRVEVGESAGTSPDRR